jgi:hypothetical protein
VNYKATVLDRVRHNDANVLDRVRYVEEGGQGLALLRKTPLLVVIDFAIDKRMRSVRRGPGSGIDGGSLKAEAWTEVATDVGSAAVRAVPGQTSLSTSGPMTPTLSSGSHSPCRPSQ